MGKRKGGGLSGLSRFVLESFKNDQNPQPSLPEPVVQNSQDPVSEQNIEHRPTKRRKTRESNTDPDPSTQIEEAGQWVEKYDATGLVPHYTKASQVPDHLKKCACCIWSNLMSDVEIVQTSHRELVISLFTRHLQVVFLTRKAGTASPPNSSQNKLPNDVGVRLCWMHSAE
jgi:hypothetical protein